MTDVAAQCALKLGARVLSGPQQHLAPVRAAGERPGPQRRQHARSEQRGLADTRRADNAHQRPLGEASDQLRDGSVAPAEELGVRAVKRGQSLERTDHGLRRGRLVREPQTWIVTEDHPFELSEGWARTQPQLVAQQRARFAIGGERVGLAPGAVEREHQLGAQALLERLGCGQPLELDDCLNRASQRKLRVDPLHLCQQAQLLKAPDLPLDIVNGCDVRERLAAPQAQRLVEPRMCAGRVTAYEQRPTLVKQPFEDRGVELLGIDRECVTALTGEEHRGVIVVENLA